MAQPKTTLYVGEYPADRLCAQEPARVDPRSSRPAARQRLTSSRSFHSRAGGLEEQVTTAILHAAFIPFGPIKDVDIPMDHQTQAHRGFGFVTFEETCVYPPSPTLQLRFFHFAIFWQPNVCVEGARRPTPTARPHPRHAPHADPMRSPFIPAQTFPQRGRGGGDG